jgi:hypothetical protein
VTTRTAVRRSALVGLGALASMALAVPASALDAGSALEETTATVAGVVDPLTAPLTTGVVEETAPVVEAAPAPVQEAVAGTTTTAPSSGEPAPTGGPSGTTTAPRNDAPAAGGAQAPAAAPAPEAAGAGVASMPGSFRSASGLEGFGGRGAGFGTAANPMSLFGAPQVFTPTSLAGDLPTPLAVAPAGGALGDVLPVKAPDALPATLVALACTVVAGTVAAHVAALRSRRQGLVAG